MTRSGWARLVIAVLLVFGCGTDATTAVDPGTDATPVPQAQLTFLRPAANVTLSRDSVSFWAVKGKNREVAMYYRPAAGRTDSVRFLRLKVPDEALFKRPDGSAFADGDSIRITIVIRDFSRLITEFSPSGLKFSASKPAELRLDFRNADGDHNRDGVVNAADSAIVPTFAIWKQEATGQPWFKLTSLVEVSSDFSEVKADVTSFTNHAVAW